MGGFLLQGAGGGGGGGGFMSGLGNLLQNKLFLQYLSAAGQDIGSGNAIGTNVNAVTQQNISAQNYMKLLKRMLAGDIPTDGKLEMDADGMKLKVPKSALNTGVETPFGASAGTSSMPSPSPDFTKYMTPQAKQLPFGQGGSPNYGGLLNPFGSSQSDISAADLAGVSPDMISQALQLKQSGEALRLRTMSEIGDLLYKQGMLEHQGRQEDTAKFGAETSRINAMRQLARDFRSAPLEVPGMGELTLDTWQALDTKTRAYAYYAYNAKQSGKEALDYNAWEKQMDPTGLERLFEQAEKDPAFKEFLFEYKRAGAARINVSPYERAKETGQAEKELDVTAPDFAGKVVKSFTANQMDSYSWNYPDGAEEYAKEKGLSSEQAVNAIQQLKVLKEMDKRIKQAYLGKGIVTKDSGGWYLDGKLIVKDPYAR